VIPAKVTVPKNQGCQSKSVSQNRQSAESKVFHFLFFSHSLVILNLTGPNWVAVGDAEKMQDRQTDRKLGSGVLSAQVEMHKPHCFFSLLFSSFYSASFLCLYSLRT
jgi:hypothetical protein